MADPEADTWPLPWWLDYLTLAEQWHCPPWELLDRKTPKRFWFQCAAHLNHARSAVRNKEQREQDAAMEKMRKG